MNLRAQVPEKSSSERLVTLAISGVLTAASLVLMLVYTSPEFSWDEADYVASTDNSWGFLWSRSDYNRHGHGPMAIYLAKLGREILPSRLPFETRLRFMDALVGSAGVGFLYWILRRSFHTSRAAALMGSGLLLLSVIRLEETNVVGPHHLMLFCTLAFAGLGYGWLDRPGWTSGTVLGAVIGFGALSMTYVIPAGLCWGIAVSIAGRKWVEVKPAKFKVAPAVLIMAATAILFVLVLWPPGVLQHVILSNFHWYLHYSHATTLVGNRLVQDAPRSAALYWLSHLDAPILLSSAAILFLAGWKAIRTRSWSARHSYLAIWLGFFLITALAAHLAGSRNLLQLLGLLCLGTGAFFDEAVAAVPNGVRICAALVLISAAANFVWLSQSSRYTPYFATSGFRAFLSENRNRLDENANAMVYNTPAFGVYVKLTGTPVNWEVQEAPWIARDDVPMPGGLRYVLISSIFDDMPAGQPMRVVEQTWPVVWRHKDDHAWEWRLYENPQASAGR